MNEVLKLRRQNGFLRRLHAWIGVVASLNLLLLITTGLLIQHRELFGLQERYIGRRLLPASYRPMDGQEVRSDIVVTDLHSGRLLGQGGAVVLDGITVAWLGLLLSGWVLFAFRYRKGQRNNGAR
jgi:hypothetical protein